MRRAHDLRVLPFGCAVVAGDQAHAVQSTEVTEHEGVPGLGLIGCAIGEGEMPRRILLPPVQLEEGVLLSRTWLNVSPPSAHPVLAGVDQLPSLGDTPLVHPVRGHRFSLTGRVRAGKRGEGSSPLPPSGRTAAAAVDAVVSVERKSANLVDPE